MRERKFWTFFIFLFGIMVTQEGVTQASAFWRVGSKAIAAISTDSRALPEDQIIRLSSVSKEFQGTKKVGQELASLALPDELLEDAFLRIAIHKNVITRETADGMFSRLSGTPGFRTTMRKLIGNSPVGAQGHLNELIIADIASMNRFRVIRIGEPFTDGVKKLPTDIDILLEKNGRTFAIEAKSLAETTYIPMDKYRADLDTLVIYKNNRSDVIPVFTITNKPIDPLYFERLRHEAGRRGIHLLFGTPTAQIDQIKMLGDIL